MIKQTLNIHPEMQIKQIKRKNCSNKNETTEESNYFLYIYFFFIFLYILLLTLGTF